MTAPALTFNGVDVTAKIAYGSLVTTMRTLDVTLVVSQADIDADFGGTGYAVVLTNPSWSGTVTSCSVRLDPDNKQVFMDFVATNASTGTAGSSGVALTDAGSGNYRDLTELFTSDLSSQSGTTGSLTTYQAILPGQTFTLTNAKLDISAVTWTATEVTARFLGLSPFTIEYDVAFAGSLSAADQAFPAFAASPAAAMPIVPSVNDRVFRTDLGMEFYYDGTRWLSSTLFVADLLSYPLNAASISATSTASFYPAPYEAGSDIWLVENVCQFFVVSGGTALGASHKWVGTMEKRASNNTATTVTTVTINSGASGAWRTDRQAIGALLTQGTYYTLGYTWTKTGTPGNLYAPAYVTYRIVAT